MNADFVTYDFNKLLLLAVYVQQNKTKPETFYQVFSCTNIHKFQEHFFSVILICYNDRNIRSLPMSMSHNIVDNRDVINIMDSLTDTIHELLTFLASNPSINAVGNIPIAKCVLIS